MLITSYIQPFHTHTHCTSSHRQTTHYLYAHIKTHQFINRCFVTSQYVFLDTQDKRKLPSPHLLSNSFLVHCNSWKLPPTVYNSIGSSLPKFDRESFARYSCVCNWINFKYIALSIPLLQPTYKLRGCGRVTAHTTVRIT